MPIHNYFCLVCVDLLICALKLGAGAVFSYICVWIMPQVHSIYTDTLFSQIEQLRESDSHPNVVRYYCMV